MNVQTKNTLSNGAVGVKNSSSKVHEITLDLQNAIFEHRLSPGMKLSEDEVGEIYGASRTIVRTALQALSHSQLVTIEKNRGAFIAKPSIREAQEVFQARALIEPVVAGMAARNITKKQLQNLKNHIDAEHKAIHENNKGRALSLSGAFHIVIADIADHQVYSDMVRSLISRSSLIIALYWKRADTTCESHSHHALIEALGNNDEKASIEVMKSHIIDLHSGLNLSNQNESLNSLARALGK